jgi:hypothetical protein
MGRPFVVPKENLPRIGLINFGVNNAGDLGDFFDRLRKTQLEPEQKLMLAVLEDAYYIATTKINRSYGKESVKRRKREQKEARDWIGKPEDPEIFFSFINCCEALRLDPSYWRKGIVAKYNGKD